MTQRAACWRSPHVTLLSFRRQRIDWKTRAQGRMCSPSSSTRLYCLSFPCSKVGIDVFMFQIESERESPIEPDMSLSPSCNHSHSLVTIITLSSHLTPTGNLIFSRIDSIRRTWMKRVRIDRHSIQEKLDRTRSAYVKTTNQYAHLLGEGYRVPFFRTLCASLA